MLSKKLVSLIGASIISIGLVGCQSTQDWETLYSEKIEMNDEEFLGMVHHDYKVTYNEYLREVNVPDSNGVGKGTFYQGMYYSLSDKLNYLEINYPVVYDKLVEAIKSKDFDKLRALEKYNEISLEEVTDNKNGSFKMYFSKHIRIATSNYNTFNYNYSMNTELAIMGYDSFDDFPEDYDFEDYLTNYFDETIDLNQGVYAHSYLTYTILNEIINKEGFTMEEQTLIWCPMCQEDTIDTDTHECTKCGYIPEDWQGYLIELGLN